MIAYIIILDITVQDRTTQDKVECVEQILYLYNVS
jgi:hypothetical protein